jgi:hypothetical protein
MGEWSPECVRCTWTKAATGPVAGARFKATDKGRRGPAWFNTPVVTIAEPGRELAFDRSGPGIGSYTWRSSSSPRRPELGSLSPSMPSVRWARP